MLYEDKKNVSQSTENQPIKMRMFIDRLDYYFLVHNI